MAIEPKLPVPVTILTGFLGAGKTTLLNNILHGDHGLKVGVLVNDFGAVNIDAQLIVGVEGQTVNLANGCICCTIRDDLLRETLGLLRRPDAPEYLIVETSGVSDPLSVAQTFMLPELADMLQVDSIVTVVDAEQLPSLNGDNAMLAMSQMAVADMIVLNKVGLVTPEQLAALKKEWLYPQARIVETNYAKVPLELLLGVGRYDPTRLLAAKPYDVHVHEEGAPSEHDHEPDDHDGEPDAVDHSLVYNTWNWHSEEPLSFKSLRKAVRTLPPSIFRVKGFLYLEEAPDRKAILHVVGMRVQMELTEPWGDDKPHSQLVVIGSAGGVDAAALQQRFQSCLASHKTKNPFTNALDSFVEWMRADN